MKQPDLIAVGYWVSDRAPDLPHPRDFVGSGYDRGTRERICRYLDSGRVFESYLGYSHCRFQCGVICSEMGDSDLSDGQWVWPEGLSHYVRAHDVALPDEFIATMERNDWRIPKDSSLPPPDTRPDGSMRNAVDYRFWRRWSEPPKG